MTSEPTAKAPPAAVTIHTERLAIDTEWAVAGRVRLRREVVTERRSIEVEVRREVLVVETDDAAAVGQVFVPVGDGGPAAPAPQTDTAPLIILLREEIPVPAVRVRAYEQVTATVFRVDEKDSVEETVRHEEVVLDELAG